jgi:uncharacterized membrane protein
MAFCSSCGSQVEGRFCPKCGTAIGAPAGPSETGAGGTATAPAVSAGMTDNMASALCYVLGLVTGILFLVLAPYNQNRTVRFHAFQSIFFHIGTIVIWVGLLIGSTILHAIPFFGPFISFSLWAILTVGVFCTWLVLIFKAYNGERFVLPIVGPLAEKQA